MKYIESEIRPWGKYFVIHNESHYKLKRIEVNPGGRLSYQYHHKRSECWTVVSGSGVFTLNDIPKEISYGDSVIIPKMAKHRIYNNSDKTLILIEVQTGEYFGEDDIIRIEDDYKRN